MRPTVSTVEMEVVQAPGPLVNALGTCVPVTNMALIRCRESAERTE